MILRACAFLLLCMAGAAAPAQAAESEIANRNLGITPKALEKVKAAQEPAAQKSEPVKEEITVYGDSPEDVAKPRKAPIQAFSDRLDKSRKLTPAEKTRMVLSFFLGGPMPDKEPSAEARTLSRSENGGSMLARPRGALQ